MKNFKKWLACALTAVVTLGGSSVAVLAAGSSTLQITSPTKGIVVQEMSEEKLDAVQDDAVREAIQEQTAQTSTEDFIKAVSKSADPAFRESAKVVAKAIAGKEFLGDFFDISKKGDVEKVNGLYVATLNIPSLPDNATGIQILHVSTERGILETIDPSAIDRKAKTITASFQDLSPAAIVIDKTADGQTAVVGNTTTNTATTNASSAAATSPKTGATTNASMWMVAALALAGAAVAASRRRKAA